MIQMSKQYESHKKSIFSAIQPPNIAVCICHVRTQPLYANFYIPDFQHFFFRKMDKCLCVSCI